MKKTIFIMLAIIFGMAPVSFAATALSDQELDQVSAGDWVVLEEGQSVEDVFHSNNTLDLEDSSQMEIQAVSNANAVDSAIAVQTNIATVTGDPTSNVAINGTNEANILNYNPSESGSESSLYETSSSESASLSISASRDASASANASASKNFSLVETLDEITTLDIAAAAAFASETECKDCETETVAVATFLLDYDKIVDYDLVILESESASASASATLHEEASLEASASSKSSSKTASSSSFRKNLSENNHINLEDNSQQLLQAVSNLNAVGSGAAVQTNIASNVGVGGTITHVNVATVVNGL